MLNNKSAVGANSGVVKLLKIKTFELDFEK